MNPLIIVAAGLMLAACSKPETGAASGSTIPSAGAMGPSGIAAGTGPDSQQGAGASSEAEITAAIQQRIKGNGPLANTGKDVRVVTEGTRVTLSGPVSTGLAREVIGDIAKRTAGVTEVDNRIEVVN